MSPEKTPKPKNIFIPKSGSSIRGKVKISKAGDKIYRGALFMPAMVAIRYNSKVL